MEIQQQASTGLRRSPNTAFVPTTAASKATMQTLRIRNLELKEQAGYTVDGPVSLPKFSLLSNYYLRVGPSSFCKGPLLKAQVDGTT